MNSDLGRNDDGVSNCSGDALHLRDEHDESDENLSSYESYAVRVLRAINSDLQKNSEECRNFHRYIRPDRLLTDLEKKHFLPNNPTPDRPCTAYVSSYYLTDSKQVFDTLAEQNFPPNSIRCLQRRLAGGMLITLATPTLERCLTLLSSVCFHRIVWFFPSEVIA